MRIFSADRLPASLQWWLWGALCLASLVAAIAGLLLGGAFESALSQISASERTSPSADITRPAPNARDFALALGPAAESTRILNLLDQAARPAAVAVQSVAFTPRGATAATLGQLEANMVLRGSYAATKHVLAELHDRLPQLTLRQLRMTPLEGQPGILQTQAVLVLWSAPLPASAAGGS